MTAASVPTIIREECARRCDFYRKLVSCNFLDSPGLVVKSIGTFKCRALSISLPEAVRSVPMLTSYVVDVQAADKLQGV
jgi:hypothetical protein